MPGKEEKAEQESSPSAASEGAKDKASTTASSKFDGEAAAKATGNESEGIDTTKGKSM